MAGERTILVVDDDPNIRQVVGFALRKAGFKTIEASNGANAITQWERHQPHLIVLDIMMPEMDGTEVCRRIRASSETPIVFLTSVDDEVDRILGLELGGDDYVTKPFSPRELVARIKAVLRRAEPRSDSTSDVGALEKGPLKLDLDRFKAFWGDNEIVLTVTEFALLRTLLGFPGKVYTRDELMTGAYGHGTVVSDRTIDSHIRRVRKKFSSHGEVVETVHGLGYKLAVD